MWLFPLLAALVALAFAASLGRQWVARRRPYQALWTIALLMYSVSSFALFLGALSGWTRIEYQIYWLFGAVLNVPFLAMGEVYLLVRNRVVQALGLLALIFVTAYAFNVVRTAHIVPGSLASHLPSGKDVFGDGTPAHRLPQYISIPSYVVLLAGTGWSAWKMRGAPQLRDRFLGTLGIAVGASVVAGAATFAAWGRLELFSISLLAGICIMFWGFLRASRKSAPARRPRPPRRPRPRRPPDPTGSSRRPEPEGRALAKFCSG